MSYQITRLVVYLEGWHMEHSDTTPGFEPDELIGRLQEIIRQLERVTA